METLEFSMVGIDIRGGTRNMGFGCGRQLSLSSQAAVANSREAALIYDPRCAVQCQIAAAAAWPW